MIDERCWKTWGELEEVAWGKRIVFFGYSKYWIDKTRKRYNVMPETILDNSKNFQGDKSEYGGAYIVAPEDFELSTIH